MHTSHADHSNSTVVYMAMELSLSKWKLAFSTGRGRKPRRREVIAGAVDSLAEEIERAKQRFDLPADTPVVSCYEAGRDGFWIHRKLTSEGIKNIVVDPSSIEVNRRKRRAKTDRLDAEKLLAMLIRWSGGEDDVWSVINPPTVEQEDARQLHRELETLKREQVKHSSRIQGLLMTQGIDLRIDRHFPEQVEKARCWNGEPIPRGMKERILREFKRMQLINQQIREIEKQRAELLRVESAATEDSNPMLQQVLQLIDLSAIGVNSAWLFVHEVFGWREIKNRRQIAAIIGLTPTPYSSGQLNRDLGISKAGNCRMRTMSVEIAWCWLRYQPQSELSCWFQRRFGAGSKRQRRIGIVALARKIMVVLGKYLKDGELPKGVKLKERPYEFRYTPSLS